MTSKNKKLQISCDGGAATGKSTGAKLIAKKFKLKFLSSGLLYRYAGYVLIKHKHLNKMDLYTPAISQYSSIIAKNYKIRKILKSFQIKFATKNKNCCIEGRDISTKILPKSDVKFFFKCNLNTAALRRYKELKKKDKKINLKDVKKALRIRNNLDTKRKNSPLLKHRDAIEIDTGKLNKKAMLKKMTKHVNLMIGKKYGI